MQPQTPNQPLSPEQGGSSETGPQVTPEQAGTAAAPAEAGKQAPQSAPSTPLPAAVATPAQPLHTGDPKVAGPAIADDVDVIEKEWVDSAEEAIVATKDDPYREEEAVEDLQIDYLKKRYGKDLEKSDDKPAGS